MNKLNSCVNHTILIWNSFFFFFLFFLVVSLATFLICYFWNFNLRHQVDPRIRYTHITLIQNLLFVVHFDDLLGCYSVVMRKLMENMQNYSLFWMFNCRLFQRQNFKYSAHRNVASILSWDGQNIPPVILFFYLFTSFINQLDWYYLKIYINGIDLTY